MIMNTFLGEMVGLRGSGSQLRSERDRTQRSAATLENPGCHDHLVPTRMLVTSLGRVEVSLTPGWADRSSWTFLMGTSRPPPRWAPTSPPISGTGC